MKAHFSWLPLRRLALGVAFSGLAASALTAQEATEVAVSARGGLQSFDNAASIESAWVLGLDAMYGVTSWLSVGPTFQVGRTNSVGKHFVSAVTYGVLNLGDTTSFFHAVQPVNVLDVSMNARVRLAGRTLSPFAGGGVGGYLLILDPQVNRAQKTMTGLSFNVGAGLSYAVTDRAGFVLDVRGLTFTDYDRADLDPRNNPPSRIENTLFFEEFAAAPANKKNIMNFVVTLGFTYVPRFFGAEGPVGVGGGAE